MNLEVLLRQKPTLRFYGKIFVKFYSTSSSVPPTRTRFAPSPTGQLHLGSLRTALFNYLYAKRTEGQFLLRIEDTDQKRTVEGAEKSICDTLRWAGLQWDEGPEIGGPYGPYRQSERKELYQQHARMLVQSGHAYRCFCAPQRLKELSAQHARMKLPTDYDRTCFHISANESEEREARGELHVIRLKAPDEYPVFTDLLYGDIRYGSNIQAHNTGSYSDPIMLKSDGMPTYHLANVVDDHFMKITHVIRATEWMPSTPKHVFMYQAFGWSPPAFAHVGLLQNEHQKKLSKRDGDTKVSIYKERGYLPEALNNFVALLGWSHSRKDDVMTMQDLIDEFSISRLTVGNTVITFQKLDFLQRSHLRPALRLDCPPMTNTSPEPLPLHPIVTSLVHSAKSQYPNLTEDYLSRCIQINLKNLILPKVYLESMIYMFTPSVSSLYLLPPAAKVFRKINNYLTNSSLSLDTTRISGLPTTQTTSGLPAIVLPLLTSLAHIPADKWTLQRIQDVFPHCANKAEDLASYQRHIVLMQFLRLALTGGMPGPGIPEVMEVLGREWVFLRFKEALELFTLAGVDKNEQELLEVVNGGVCVTGVMATEAS